MTGVQTCALPIYDDEGDFLTLTRGAFGRRITPADPARSLLVIKPTNAVPHKGGERFKVESPEWTMLVNWIAAGAPGPRADDPRAERLIIEPQSHGSRRVKSSASRCARIFPTDTRRK